jgi:hypothetical protein
MGVSTLQAYFFYSKQEETLWTSVLAKEEYWRQPRNLAQKVSLDTSYLRIQHTNLYAMLYYDGSLLVSS